MSLIKDYFEKTKQYQTEYGEKTVVLMQVGAFFEVYGLKNVSNGTIYESPILDFARICDLNVVDKKICVGLHSVMMAGFKDMILEKYIKKLQDSGYTSVVFVQDEQAPNTTRSLAGIFSPGTYFSCDTETINNHTCCIWIQVVDFKNNILAKLNNSRAIPSGKRKVYVGVSIINIYTGETNIFEFNEIYSPNPTTFDELERIISIYHPSETILISNVGKKESDDIINFANITSTAIHFVPLLDDINKNPNIRRANNCEKQIYQKQILEKFFKIYDYDIFIQPFCENIIATQSFCYLLDFIYQHNPHLVNKIKEPNFENIGDKLILANHSLKQLNIIDDIYKGKHSSVVALLNKCITPMGKRTFVYKFLNPITNISLLEKEYNITEHCLQNGFILYNSIKNELIKINDITKLSRQMIIQKITPKNLYQLYSSIQHISAVHDIVKTDKILMLYLKEKIPEIDNLLDCVTEITDFIDSNLDIQKCNNIDSLQKLECNLIKSNVNAELDAKVIHLTNSQDKLESCRSFFHNLLVNYESSTKKTKAKPKPKPKPNTNVKTTTESDTSTVGFVDDEDVVSNEYEYVKIHETEKNNYSLIATERRCKILEDIIKKTQHTMELQYISSLDKEKKVFELDMNKNSIIFTKQSSSNRSITSSQINELCKNISTMKIQLNDIVSKVYSQIVSNLCKFQKQLEILSEFIIHIDFVFSKAYVAKEYGYCKPIISNVEEKSFVKVEDLRHCLIEHLQQNEIYVANDISLGRGNDNTNGILLYGTNAVGKTSLIRALGIAIIMAQAGFFVPASSFVFKPYKYIFTRILGNDNIFKGLSTFAVEMSELRTILRLADQNSLVLGDELCSGTESISAISIFVAGIQQLHNVESSFIFATHLHEIIKYDEITELSKLSIKHMSVIYDKELDALVYDRRLRDGPGNNMYGLEVCKSLSLPQEFLERANNIRMKYHPESGSILESKISSYNSKHIKGICERCGESFSSEVHHLQHQKNANDNGIIKTKSRFFHKNHTANLISVCKKCHDTFHKTNIQHQKTKTTKGIILQETKV
jgi:DNA mismatch repair protein MutS